MSCRRAVAADEDDRPAGTVVVVVDLDGGAVLPAGAPAGRPASAPSREEQSRCLPAPSDAPTGGLGHVGLAHHGGRPSVRTVGWGDTLVVEGLGDLGEGLALGEQRPDLLPPSIVPVV